MNIERRRPSPSPPGRDFADRPTPGRTRVTPVRCRPLNDLDPAGATWPASSRAYTPACQLWPTRTRRCHNGRRVKRRPTEPTKKTLAVYGAAFGFGLAALVISLGTGPGRTSKSSTSLERESKVSRSSGCSARSGSSRTEPTSDVHGLRIGSELGPSFRHKGQDDTRAARAPDRMTRASFVLIRLVAGQTPEVDERTTWRPAHRFARRVPRASRARRTERVVLSSTWTNLAPRPGRHPR